MYRMKSRVVLDGETVGYTAKKDSGVIEFLSVTEANDLAYRKQFVNAAYVKRRVWTGDITNDGYIRSTKGTIAEEPAGSKEEVAERIQVTMRQRRATAENQRRQLAEIDRRRFETLYGREGAV